MSHTEEAPARAEGVDTATPPVRSSTLLIRSLRLWRTRIGVIFVLILVVVAVVGPWVAPHAADEFVARPYSKPGAGAGLFGTDYLGQDVLSRFLHGGGGILVMSVVSTAIGLLFGVTIGLVAAYARNALDDVLMRAMDVIMAFPQIMLALVAVSLVGAQTWVIIVAIALTTAPRVARVARGAAQPVVERDFVAATESMGVSRSSAPSRRPLVMLMFAIVDFGRYDRRLVLSSTRSSGASCASARPTRCGSSSGRPCSPRSSRWTATAPPPS